MEKLLEFEVSAVIPATPEELYRAWLDSELHTAMTGGEAVVSAELGGEFSAWDGYISGSNLELTPAERIVQSWRTMEFDDNEGDSRVTISFAVVEGGTQITIVHADLPPHGTQYIQGWEDHYFTPMCAYFGDG